MRLSGWPSSRPPPCTESTTTTFYEFDGNPVDPSTRLPWMIPLVRHQSFTQISRDTGIIHVSPFWVDRRKQRIERQVCPSYVFLVPARSDQSSKKVLPTTDDERKGKIIWEQDVYSTRPAKQQSIVMILIRAQNVRIRCDLDGWFGVQYYRRVIGPIDTSSIQSPKYGIKDISHIPALNKPSADVALKFECFDDPHTILYIVVPIVLTIRIIFTTLDDDRFGYFSFDLMVGSFDIA